MSNDALDQALPLPLAQETNDMFQSIESAAINYYVQQTAILHLMKPHRPPFADSPSRTKAPRKIQLLIIEMFSTVVGNTKSEYTCQFMY